MPRKILLAGAALVLVSGGLGTFALLKAGDSRRATELAQKAEVARGTAVDLVRARLSLLEGKAVSAASVPVLRAQLGVVDANTLRDGFRTEPWWQSVREAFPIYGIAMGPKLDVLEGAHAGDFDAEKLLENARAKGQASAVLPHGETPLLAAAASIDRPGLRPALLVAQPLDVALLDEISNRIKGAVLLTDGKSTLLSVGSQRDRDHLASARGHEADGSASGEGWNASAAQLGPGLFLWVHGRAAAEDAAPVPLDLIALWVLTAVGVGVLLTLGLRKPAAPEPLEQTMVHEEPVAPAQPTGPRTSGPRQSIPRISKPGITASGATNPAANTTGPSASPRGSVTNPGAAARTGKSDPTRRAGQSDPNRPRTGRSDPGARASRTGQTGRSDPGGLGMTAGTNPVKGGPQKFGRYWLLDRLGEGGMAEVYLAVAFGAENFRRTFVLKRLRGDAVRTEALVNMFIDEAKLASSLIHGNIVPVFDFGREGDEYFIAQEYILGRDLRRVITRAVERDQKVLDPRYTVLVMRETLRALDYAHAATNDQGKPLNLVHRDVSPNNILVSARGEVKLFDFGIAKADEGRLTQTQTGVVKGNIRFMSPEQARGETVDARADLASLGLVFYFALTGQTLYEGDTGYVLLMQAALGLTPETEAKLAQLPPEFAAVIRKSIAAREERFQSAAEFEQALASLPAASGSEMRKEMDRLFGADLKAEEGRVQNLQIPDEQTMEWGEPEGAPPEEDQPS